MGDRAMVFVEGACGDLAPCGMYLHWGGSVVIDIISAAVKRMRKGDPGYSMARLIGCAHGKIAGNLSLGVVQASKTNSERDFVRTSPGDAGVAVYNCSTGRVRLFGGYLADECGDELQLPVPPAS